MEADETLLVERLDHQKHNCRNDGQVGQRAGHIIGQSSGRGSHWAYALAARALRAGRSIRDLRSTGWTKGHKTSFELTGTLSERSVARNTASWHSGGPPVCSSMRPPYSFVRWPRFPLSFQARHFNCREAGTRIRCFRLLKGTDDHHCFGTAAVGHIVDDADA